MLSYDEATHCIWWGNNYYLMVGPSPVPWCIRGLPQAEPHDATTLVKKDEQPEMLPQNGLPPISTCYAMCFWGCLFDPHVVLPDRRVIREAIFLHKWIVIEIHRNPGHCGSICMLFVFGITDVLIPQGLFCLVESSAVQISKPVGSKEIHTLKASKANLKLSLASCSFH